MSDECRAEEPSSASGMTAADSSDAEMNSQKTSFLASPTDQLISFREKDSASAADGLTSFKWKLKKKKNNPIVGDVSLYVYMFI